MGKLIPFAFGEAKISLVRIFRNLTSTRKCGDLDVFSNIFCELKIQLENPSRLNFVGILKYP